MPCDVSTGSVPSLGPGVQGSGGGQEAAVGTGAGPGGSWQPRHSPALGGSGSRGIRTPTWQDGPHVAGCASWCVPVAQVVTREPASSRHTQGERGLWASHPASRQCHGRGSQRAVPRSLCGSPPMRRWLLSVLGGPQDSSPLLSLQPSSAQSAQPLCREAERSCGQLRLWAARLGPVLPGIWQHSQIPLQWELGLLALMVFQGAASFR